ncbi:hypothetical protein GDO78_017998 [Eleutherodactylus coqui]|uniref:Uncharacterized protein n=1 Tax=Eleutherodactylus coqui TaxID=57060 RepID=A0A8J6JRA1_ELECQ|nr:hypothetical protein GDO78_017998 [Eleutherodactylus coqui]
MSYLGLSVPGEAMNEPLVPPFLRKKELSTLDEHVIGCMEEFFEIAVVYRRFRPGDVILESYKVSGGIMMNEWQGIQICLVH